MCDIYSTRGFCGGECCDICTVVYLAIRFGGRQGKGGKGEVGR